MDVMKLANSLPMWIACGIPVVFVMIQALLFAREAYRSGEKVGLTKTQMNKAIKSSAVTSIGPSIVVLSGMLSLLVTVGGPVGWMRLSMIGSVMFESIAAGLGTSAVGVTLGTDPMTKEALTMAIWTMILCSVGWVLFGTFSANKMEKIIAKSTHNRRERPVCGHRGRSRGPFYYRITTFGKGPWDARDPHKTTFMALKHVIRLSIWQRQKETPGVEKAPGVSLSRDGRNLGRVAEWMTAIKVRSAIHGGR